jgi:hypothetical protein
MESPLEIGRARFNPRPIQIGTALLESALITRKRWSSAGTPNSSRSEMTSGFTSTAVSDAAGRFA